MYPINLDYNYQSLFVSFFRAINKHFKPKSISDIENFEKTVYPKLIKEVQANARPRISQNLKLINEHSKRLTSKTIEGLSRKRNFKISRIKLLNLDFIPNIPESAWRKYIRGDADSLAVTNILPESQIKAIIEKNGDLITKKYFNEFENLDTTLIDTLYKDHISKVKNIMLESLKNGESIDTITKKIQAATSISENRARFWATDQSSKFFGQVQKARQTAAGFPGYIWRTQKDKRVRPTHVSRHGMYIEWATSTLNPGDDFRCRCFAEPSFGDDVPDHYQSVREFETRKLEQNFETGAGEIAYKSWYDKLQKEAQASYEAMLAKKVSKQTLKTEQGAPVKGNNKEIVETKNIIGNMGPLTTLEQNEALMTGSPLEIGVIFDGKQRIDIVTSNGKNYIDVENIDLENKILSHNHPEGYPFSFADLKVFITKKLKEIRVITKQYTYSISNPDGSSLNHDEIKKFYDSVYLEAKKEVPNNLSAKDKSIEIQNKQWEKTADKFKFKYNRL